MPFQRKLWHQKIANKNIKIFLISQLLRSNTYLLKYFACYCDQILCPKVFLQARHEGIKVFAPIDTFDFAPANTSNSGFIEQELIPLWMIRLSVDTSQTTHQPAGAFRGFCSMKRLGTFLLPLDGMLVNRNQPVVKVLQDAGVSMFRIRSKLSILCRQSCKLGSSPL